MPVFNRIFQNTNLIRHLLPLIFVCVVALAFRLPLLDTIPPGLHFDEGGEGIAALDVTHGQFKIWWPIGGGKEPLMAYLVQPLFWVFGPTRLALRLYTALMGTLTVFAVYFLALQLFPPTSKQTTSPLLPTLAALGLATAFWHIAYSRIAFRALSNPAVEALALAFLWRGLRKGRWRDFLVAGFFTGSLVYTYLVGRFVPIAIVIFFIIEGGIAWFKGNRPLWWQYWLQLGGLVGVALLVFAPLARFFIQNPAAFVDRAGSVSIFSPTMNGGNLWGTLGQTIWLTLGTFLSLTGDPNPLANIPGKPELGPLLAILFIIGLGLAGSKVFTHLKSHWGDEPDKGGQGLVVTPAFWAKSYLFLLVWWLVMLLPAILAPEGAPHHLRLIGTAPGTYIFVAIGLTAICTWLAERIPGLTHRISVRRLGWVIGLLIFAGLGYQTWHTYFVVWANDFDHTMTFDMYAEDLAHLIAADQNPDVAYAIPMDLRAAHEARHYSLDFLYQGATPYGYVVVDEATVAQSLTTIAKGKETLKIVRWLQDKHREADARQVIDFLLATSGARQIEITGYPVYQIETYTLPSTTTLFELPVTSQPIDVTLDNILQVRRADISPKVTPSGNVAIAITYAPIAPLAVDYKASLRLLDAGGGVIVQTDRTLRHNWHQGTSLWPREEVNEYYLLPLPADTSAGVYTVQLVIYHPETLTPLTADGLATVEIGEIIVP